MKNFDYNVPTRIIFGKDTHLQIGEIVKSYGYKKVLLHYGQSSIKKTGLHGKVTASLSEKGIDYVELGGVEPNPKVSLVRKGIDLCRKEKCDMILAIGGGSVIDSSKGIAVGTPYDGDVWDFFTGKAVPKARVAVGTILTIAASGSEMSSPCVLTNEDGLLKRGFMNEINRPLFSILNPELTYSVNKYQTACGIVDIMMHTLERYFSDPVSAELTDRLAEGILKSVISSGRVAMENPSDYEARATLMLAGSFSHNGITGLGRTPVLICHQIEHELSGMYDFVVHGAGLSVLFLAWAKYVYKHDLNLFCKYATRVWNVDVDFEDQSRTASAGIAATEDFFKSLGMPVRLSEFDIKDPKIEEMSEKCTFWGARTLPGTIPLNKKEIMEIFELSNKA